MNRAAKISAIVLSTGLFSACGTKTEIKTVEVPKVTTVEVPVVVKVPGETTVLTVPEIISVDKSVGIKSLPKPISSASPEIKSLGSSVAKVFAATGASGTGFFISKDGLFLTNEHVIPISACANRKCPGYKIVTDFYRGGTPKSYSDFEVLAQDNGQYDFALIKVNLPKSETVEPLEIDLSEFKLDTANSGANHVVLGHPGGAGLSFAEAKTTSLVDVSIQFLATVIPGNSGGPLIDLSSKKVIGLVKAMRTMPVRDGAGSSYFENFNRATSLFELDKLIQSKAGVSLLDVTDSNNLKELNRSSAALPVPDDDDFGSIFRRPTDDVRVSHAYGLFMRLIGSVYEEPALSLMFKKSNKFSGPISTQVLNRFLKLSLSVGRALKFAEPVRVALEKEIASASVTPEDWASRITLAYFDAGKRSALQSECLASVPKIVQASILAPYKCLSLKHADGSSVLPPYADWLTQQQTGFKTVDEFGSVTGLLMMSAPLGISEPDDLNAVAAIDSFVDQKARDLEILMRNDGYAVEMLTGLSGVGNFRDSFPMN